MTIIRRPAHAVDFYFRPVINTHVQAPVRLPEADQTMALVMRLNERDVFSVSGWFTADAHGRLDQIYINPPDVGSVAEDFMGVVTLMVQVFIATKCAAQLRGSAASLQRLNDDDEVSL